MYKKGISLVVLTITIVVLLILVTVIIGAGINTSSSIAYMKNKESIELIEQEIKKAKLNNQTYGTVISNVSNDYDNTIDAIEDKYNVDLDVDYYLLTQNDLQQMGIKRIGGEYIVNYEKGIVFSVNPFYKNDELIYTTQTIE